MSYARGIDNPMLLIYRVLSLSLMIRLKKVEQRKRKVGGMVDDITEEANPGVVGFVMDRRVLGLPLQVVLRYPRTNTWCRDKNSFRPHATARNNPQSERHH
jgi:hypothetical protein